MRFIKFTTILMLILSCTVFSRENNEQLLKKADNLSLQEAYPLYEEVSENYINSGSFHKAIENYKIMYDKYKDDSIWDSKTDELLRNIAYLYQDSLQGNRINNNFEAAKYFEKLIKNHPNSDYLKEALLNAVFDYRLVGKDDKGEEMIDIFLKKYPDSPLAKNYLMEKAYLMSKQGKYKSSLKIYQNFLAKKGKDSLNVAAHYFIGMIYKNDTSLKNRDIKAVTEFKKACEISRKLRMEQKPYNQFYFVESLFELSEYKKKKFKNISFKLPLTKTIKQEYKKNKLFQELLVYYDEILNFGHKRYGEVLLNKIKLLEDFGNTKYNQELDKKSSAIDDILYRKEVYKLAGKFYEKAIDEYRLAVPQLLEFIKLFGDKYGLERERLETVINEYEQIFIYNKKSGIKGKEKDKYDNEYLNALSTKRILESDTTIVSVRKQLNIARNSILRMQYTIAHSNKNIAEEYLKIRSEYGTDNSDSYFEKLYFIDNAVIPFIENILKSYQKTIELSKEMGIKNEWVDKSVRELSHYSDILTNAYIEINDNVATTFKKYIKYSFNYASSKKKKYIKEIGKKFLTNNEIFEEMISLVDYIKIASLKSITSSHKNLKAAIESNIASPKVINKIQNNLMQFILNTNEKNKKMQALIIENYFKADSLYWKNTKNTKYELLADYFQETNELFQNLSYQIFSEGYKIIKEYKIDNDLSNKILHKLIQLKPAEYVSTLGIKTKNISFSTDMSWLSSAVYYNDFYRNNIHERKWHNCYIINKTVKGMNRSKIKKAISLWTKEINREKIHAIESKDRERLLPQKPKFFRKHFNLKNIPVKGEINLMVDDEFILIVNEETVVKSEDLKDSKNWKKVRTFDISKFLRNGDNVIVIVAGDSNKEHYGLAATINIEMMENYNKDKMLKVVK